MTPCRHNLKDWIYKPLSINISMGWLNSWLLLMANLGGGRSANTMSAGLGVVMLATPSHHPPSRKVKPLQEGASATTSNQGSCFPERPGATARATYPSEKEQVALHSCVALGHGFHHGSCFLKWHGYEALGRVGGPSWLCKAVGDEGSTWRCASRGDPPPRIAPVYCLFSVYLLSHIWSLLESSSYGRLWSQLGLQLSWVKEVKTSSRITQSVASETQPVAPSMLNPLWFIKSLKF